MQCLREGQKKGEQSFNASTLLPTMALEVDSADV